MLNINIMNLFNDFNFFSKDLLYFIEYLMSYENFVDLTHK